MALHRDRCREAECECQRLLIRASRKNGAASNTMDRRGLYRGVISGRAASAPLGAVLHEVRAFRIYDGPTEVHKWSLDKKIRRDWKAGNSMK